MAASDLPLPQQIALLTICGGDLAKLCIVTLSGQGAPAPTWQDFAELRQAGLAAMAPGGRFHRLSPRGKFAADDLARAIALAHGLHHVSYGRDANKSYFARCSCGQFSTHRSHVVPNALLKLMRDADQHQRRVEQRGSMLLLEAI